MTTTTRGPNRELGIQACGRSRKLDAEALAKLGRQPRWGITHSNPMGTTIRRNASDQGGKAGLTSRHSTMTSHYDNLNCR